MSEYVNNDDFYLLIKEYRRTKSKKNYEQIGKIFLEIVNHLLYSPRFINYDDNIKTNIVSDACWFMVKYMDNFDSEQYSNPFSYFTTCAWNAVLANINKFHKTHRTTISLNSMDNLNETDSVNVDYNETYKVDEDFVENEIKKYISHYYKT